MIPSKTAVVKPWDGAGQLPRPTGSPQWVGKNDRAIPWPGI